MATPRKKKEDLKKVGRKLFDGKDIELTLKKLEEAFSIGCTDSEACAYADISPASLYMYQKGNPKFQERKKQLKDKPILLARKIVVDAIQGGDSDLAFKYLERKRRDEFALRVENENKEVLDFMTLSDAELKAINEEGDDDTDQSAHEDASDR